MTSHDRDDTDDTTTDVSCVERESLVLAAMDVQARYRDSDDESRSLAEWFVDELLLPLIRRLRKGGE